MRGEPFAGRLQKPEPRKRVKNRKKRKAGRDRKKARLLVYEREGMRCQRCKRAVSVDVDTPYWADNFAHVNEMLPKSRGGSPTELSNLELLCGRCHLPNGRHAPTADRQALIERRAS